MLVLSRKIGESIMIGEGIEVKVISIDGDQVKLGIEAPRHIKVHRHEIFKAIQEENKAALDVTEQLINQLKNF
ncbi:carbon storage regulator CsrA [Kurthia sp. YJT4]|uniref:carbon storage regulator CsrA n=1 Tax=Kurthia sp. YJT4 TaxID=3049086 RepID=UPI00254AA9F7|nr:carbon storage regulator CsrA [Kurthia sp. YJT4]WIL39132.1 carbon storage regulator CsrA [Kurthia sp. YJT4]